MIKLLFDIDTSTGIETTEITANFQSRRQARDVVQKRIEQSDSSLVSFKNDEMQRDVFINKMKLARVRVVEEEVSDNGSSESS